MASVSNGAVCNGVLNKASSVAPKWKVRKVSAIRDFPPGCGPNAPKLKPKPMDDEKKNEVSDVNSVKLSENCNGPLSQPVDDEKKNEVSDVKSLENGDEKLSREEVKSPSEFEMGNLLDDLVGKVVASAAMPVNGNDVSSSAKPLGDDFWQTLQINALELYHDFNKVEAENENSSLADELGAQNDKKSPVEQDLPISNGNIVKEDPNVKTKYPKRRVSATREFPPFCGRNAPCPTEEERAQIIKRRELLEREIAKREESETYGTDENRKIEEFENNVFEEKTEIGDVRENDSPKRKLKVHAPERKIKPKKLKERDVKKNENTEIVVFTDKSLDISHRDDTTLGSDEDEEMRDNNTCNENKEKMNYVNSQSSKKNKGIVTQEQGKGDSSVGKSSRKRPASSKKIVAIKKGVVTQEHDDVAHAGHGAKEFEVTLPPFGPSSSSGGNMRNKVRETLRLFQAICRKILQGEEANPNKQGKASNRIDLEAAKIIKTRGKEVNTETQIIGAVPGVEVGDEFMYRVELALVGVHRLYQAGIDYIMNNGMIICVSIVASGGYADELDNPDILIYSGQGGMPAGKNKEAEDQKLERGNLALKNSIAAKNPVRVIRGTKERVSKSDSRGKMVPSYAYDGLYMVEKYWQEVGHKGKLVFKFELKRIPGQPELSWKEVKKSKKFTSREGVCVDDISNGKEVFRICAVNTIDNEKPPNFNYITKIIYPTWYSPTPPEGCGCVDGCSDSQKCSCVMKNGEEIPYNHNGAIVEAKPLVHECGPSCKCPPSCYNRVTQHGMKIQLEIFKTESRGWGVRSLSSIPSGSFICEYIGELLDDKEAEQRHNDEYLFDIGQNYTDCQQSSSADVAEDSGFTIDAAVYGNVGRFINHSCSPNLYAQNVLFDHEYKSMPHIMLFAAENIPALQELTYHYNYTVDQVRDSDGNVKMKSCYCGSEECTGRMY